MLLTLFLAAELAAVLAFAWSFSVKQKEQQVVGYILTMVLFGALGLQATDLDLMRCESQVTETVANTTLVNLTTTSYTNAFSCHTESFADLPYAWANWGGAFVSLLFFFAAIFAQTGKLMGEGR